MKYAKIAAIVLASVSFGAAASAGTDFVNNAPSMKFSDAQSAWQRLSFEAQSEAINYANSTGRSGILIDLHASQNRSPTPHLDGNHNQGTPGMDGRPGRDGKDGLNGKDGKDGLNGKDGKDGAAGKDGINGVDGKDGTNGTDGTNGVDGKDGAKGDTGAAGKDGVNGTNGVDGKDGVNGTNGVDGKDGSNGTNGKDGSNGKDGAKGDSGLNGTDGRDGLDGKDADMTVVNSNTQRIASSESHYNDLARTTNQRFEQLGKKVDDNRKHASAGIAGVAAMANIPQVSQGSRFSVGAGVGSYDSEQGLAVGVSARFNGNIVTKASVSATTQHDMVLGAGISYEW